MNPLVKGYRYGDCRLLGHNWHVVPSDWTPQFGVPMTTRCERCNIERRDSVNRNSGDVEARRYVYPDGYLFHLGDDPSAVDVPRRVDFRLAWLDDAIKTMKANKRKAQAA